MIREDLATLVAFVGTDCSHALDIWDLVQAVSTLMLLVVFIGILCHVTQLSLLVFVPIISIMVFPDFM